MKPQPETVAEYLARGGTITRIPADPRANLAPDLTAAPSRDCSVGATPDFVFARRLQRLKKP